MSNLTVTIPDEVYRAARIKAAERGTSVSALVADYLRSLADAKSEFRRRELEQARIQEQIGSFSAKDRLSRDDAHLRALR